MVVRVTEKSSGSLAVRLARVHVGRGQALGYAIALAAVALVTVAIAEVRRYASVDNISMLYLIAVLALAVGIRPWPSSPRLGRGASSPTTGS